MNVSPLTFGLSVGLAHGLLAVVRNKEVRAISLVAAAIVVGVSEATLVHESTEQRLYFGVQSALGTLLGFLPFVWTTKPVALPEEQPV